MRRQTSYWILTMTAMIAALLPPNVATAGPTADPGISYSYDAAGRLAGVSAPGQGSASYSYDPDGNLLGISRTDAAANAAPRAKVTADPVSVTGVSPTSGTAGTSVTISGSGFTASSTVVFGRTRARVTAATSTSLTVMVPVAAGSGPVMVATEDRTASSASDFVVIPVAGTMAAAGTLAIDGTGSSVSLAQQHRFTLLRFKGTKGQRLSIGLTGAADPAKVALSIYDPYGAAFARDEYGASLRGDSLGGAYDLPPLPTSGFYQLAVDPQADNLGTATVTLSSRITGSLTVNGSGTTLSLSRPGQETELTLQATKGQTIGLGLSGATFAAGKTATVTIREPNGTALLWDGTATSGRLKLDGQGDYLLTPQASGTYTVVLTSTDASAGAVTVTASTALTGGLTLGSSKATTISRPGQHVRLTYAAVTNQELDLDLTGNTSAYKPVVVVSQPDGTALWQGELTGHTELPPLPVGGTYTVDLGVHSGTGVVTIKLSARATPSTMTATGSSVVARVPGQGDTATFKFSATAGKLLSFGLSTSTFSDSVALDVAFIDPSGTTYYSLDDAGSGTGIWITPTDGGTYKLKVSAHDGKSTGSIALTLSSEVAGGTLTSGAETAWSATRPGQTTRYSFAGTAGQRLSLVLGWPGPEYWVAFRVLKPDGTVLRDEDSWSGVDLDPLPTTGTYQVIVHPYGHTRSASLRIGPRSTGAVATIDGPPAPLAIGLPGGNTELSFTATAAQRITVALSNSDFDRNPAQLRMYAPDKTQILATTAYDSSFIDLTTTKAGTYRLVMSPPYGDLGSGDIVLSNQVDGGTISRDTAKTVSMPRAFQSTYFTYRGTAGETLQLSLGQLTTKYRPFVYLTGPDGTQLTGDSSDDNPLLLGKLSTSGNYQIHVNPFYSKGSGTATVSTVAGAGVAALKGMAGPAPLQKVKRSVVVVGHRPDPTAAPSCAACSPGTPGPPSVVPVPGGSVVDGDPVDLGTGLLGGADTDLTVPDVMPLAVSRTYQQGDLGIRAFGVGQGSDYDLFLYSPNGASSAALVLPGGGQVVYDRVTPAGPLDHEHLNGVYVARGTPTGFSGSTLVWTGSGFEVRLRNGTTMVFGEGAPLQAIRDRYGNTITITRGPGGYDGDNNPLSDGPIQQVTSPNGRWIKFSTDRLKRITRAEDNTGRVTSYTYDGSGHLATVTDPAGGVTSYGYDAQGRMLTIKNARGITTLTNVFDIAGRVSKQTLGDGGVYLFAYTANAAGKIVETRVTDPRGSVRRLTFDSGGYSTSETDAFGTSLAQVSSFTRDPATKAVTSTLDARSRRTDFGYNAFGDITSVTQLAGTASARTERFSYDGPFGQLSQSSDWVGRTTSTTYRPDGSVATVTDPMSRVTRFETNDEGQPVKETDNLGQVKILGYVFGDLVSTTEPGGRVLRQVFDSAGRVVKTVDPTGASWTNVYDALGRVTSNVDPLGQSTAMAYDAAGNLKSVTDARGNITAYSYDEQNRQTAKTDPLNRVTGYSYDAAGSPLSVVSPDGRRTESAYDALGRQTTTKWFEAGSSTAASTITYGFDSGNRQVSTADSASGTISNIYDELDRLTRATTPNGQIDYVYTAADERTKMTVAGQTAVNYTYNSDGQLTGQSQGTNVVTTAYDAAGRRSSLTLPDGIKQDYGYNQAGQVAGITYSRTGTTLGDLAYGYDDAGRVTSVGGSFARTTVPSAYQATYDAANQVTSVGGTAYQYDASGQLVADGSRRYTWDLRGQLASVVQGGRTTSYAYDGLGRRSSAGTTGFLYDGVNAVAELSGGAVSATLLEAGTDQVFARTSGGVTRSLLTDALGSTVSVADSNGVLGGQYTYGPFGASTVAGDDGGNRSQFTGRENDGDGLYYYRSRYYSADDQRFVSSDPLGLGGGDTNTYAYAGNQPTNLTDPSGLSTTLRVPTVGEIWGAVKEAFGWVTTEMLKNDAVAFIWRNRTVAGIVAGVASMVVGAIVIGAGAIAGTAAAIVGSLAAVAGVLLVIGATVLSIADTYSSCSSGDKTGCGLGIAGLALGTWGLAWDKAMTAVVEEGGALYKTGKAWVVPFFSTWSWSNIWTGITDLCRDQPGQTNKCWGKR